MIVTLFTENGTQELCDDVTNFLEYLKFEEPRIFVEVNH